MLEQWPIKLLLSFVLGAVIGLEREINEKKDIIGDKTDTKTAILGLRTFSLVSGLGAIAGLLYLQYPILSGIVALGFIVILVSFYILDSRLTLDPGITTEIALFYSFLIGLLLSFSIVPTHVVVALTIIVTLFMSRKERIKTFVDDVSKHEINAFVSFAILAFVILPFLPNVDYALKDIPQLTQLFINLEWDHHPFIDLVLLNPFKLWFIVVIITGVDLLGYILERLLGTKSGWFITSIIGGIVSSTATTVSIAQESKTNRQNQKSLVSGAIFATGVSFFPIGFLLVVLNVGLFIAFLPTFISLILSSFIIGFYFMRLSKNANDHIVDEQKIVESHSIFDFVAALKFGALYLLINIGSKVAITFWGEYGFLVTTALGAFTGIDAVIINTTQLVGTKISVSLGIWSLILANTVNLLAKSLYAYLHGSSIFFKQLLVSMSIIIGISIVTTLIFT